MRIREGTPADRDAIVAFDHVAQSDPERIRFIDRILRSGTCLVAEHDDTVAAYGALEYTFYEQGFVSMLYVAEPHRRQGIGRTLMQALAARRQSCSHRQTSPTSRCSSCLTPLGTLGAASSTTSIPGIQSSSTCWTLGSALADKALRRASGARHTRPSSGSYSCSSSQRSASIAAMQPVPAAVTACR